MFSDVRRELLAGFQLAMGHSDSFRTHPWMNKEAVEVGKI